MLIRSNANDSNPKGIKATLIVAMALGSMALSAVAGAWVQSVYLSGPASVQSVPDPVVRDQVNRDSAFVRENVNLLAAKVGDLQARLMALDGLSQRVADAAGVSSAEPEIKQSLDYASPMVMDYITDSSHEPFSAEHLGRQVDLLQRQAVDQKDRLALLDYVLTRQTGIDASLPTLAPINYPYLSSSYGWRRNPVTRRHSMHEVLDFKAPKGTAIYAASGGVVTEARYHSGYGKMVEINHGNGLVTRYAHASSIGVKAGDLVEKGQLIAKVGSTGRSTGAHLHFEIRMAGHPLDPTLFLAAGPAAPRGLLVDATKEIKTILREVR